MQHFDGETGMNLKKLWTVLMHKFTSQLPEFTHQYKIQIQENLCKTATQKDQKLVFKTNYCLMQVKSIAVHSAILLTFIKLPFVIKIFVLSLPNVTSCDKI